MSESIVETGACPAPVSSDGVPRPRQAADDTPGHEAVVLLERTRGVVDPELRAAVESLPVQLRRIALYHFGWSHADGTPAAGNAGKAIRPALVLAAASALGGAEARAAAVRARRRSNWSTTSRCCTTT